MKKSFFCCSLASLVSLCCQAMYEPTQFFVREGEQLHVVKHHDLSPLLRSMNQRQLEKFVTTGNRIKTIKLSNGDFRLQEAGGLMGGGPWGAAILAAVGYPVVGVAALAATIASIPTAGPACIFVGAGVATAGAALVTKGVIVAAVVPTP